MNSLLFLISTLFVILLGNASAQNLSVGCLSGVNFPNLHELEKIGSSSLGKNNKKKTLLYGVAVTYKLNKYFHLRLDPFIEERGWIVQKAFTINPNTGNIDFSRLNYVYPFLTFPFLVEFGLGDKWRIFCNTGINSSRRIGGKTVTEDNLIPLVFVFPEDKKPEFDFAWISGAGIMFGLSSKISLRAEYRYYHSWTPIGVGYSVDSVVKHRGQILALSAYYNFIRS